MNNHLRISIDIEEEFEYDEDFQLIEFMKAIGRDYIRKNLADFTPTNEQCMAVVLHPKMKQLRRMNSNERECAYALVDLFVVENSTSNVRALQQTAKKSEISSLADFEDADEEETATIYTPEFTKFLNEKLPVENGAFDLMRWWFYNRERYPTLFRLFLKISSIPASSAPAERTFSIAGAIVTDRRSSLLPKSVGNIILCRNMYNC